MIVGLEDITEGDLLIGGTKVNDKAPRDRNLAMVFQNYALYPHLTVVENMAFPLRLKKVADAEVDRRVREAAEDARAHRAPRAQAGEPVRRPAPARGDGPGDHPRGRGLPVRRAAVEPRRQAPRSDAHRDLRLQKRLGVDDRVRHPRPGRGDDARRPGRACCARASSSRSARRASCTTRRSTSSWPASSVAADELHAGRRRGRRPAPAVRWIGKDALDVPDLAGKELLIAGLRPEHLRTHAWSTTASGAVASP